MYAEQTNYVNDYCKCRLCRPQAHWQMDWVGKHIHRHQVKKVEHFHAAHLCQLFAFSFLFSKWYLFIRRLLGTFSVLHQYIELKRVKLSLFPKLGLKKSQDLLFLKTKFSKLINSQWRQFSILTFTFTYYYQSVKIKTSEQTEEHA